MRCRPGLLALVVLLVGAGGCKTSERPQPGASRDSLLAPGDSLYALGEFQEARTLWQEALTRPGVAGTVGEARLVTWLGLAAMRLGEYDQSRQLGERAVTLAERLNEGSELARAKNGLALLAWHEGRLSDASTLGREAVSVYQGLGDAAGVARASNTLGLADFDLGRFDEARDAFMLTRESGRVLENPLIEGRALSNLAMWETRAGDPVRAVEFLAEARALIEGSGDMVGLANALGQGAVAYAALGRQGEALAAIDSALGVARTHGLRDEEANDLIVAATIYADAGDADQALQAWARAREINRDLGLTIESGMVLREEATVRANRGAYDLARQNALEALAVHRQAEARMEEFLDLLVLGDVERRADRLVEAERLLPEARALVRELGSASARVALALLESRIADDRRQPVRLLATLAAVESDLHGQGPGAEAEVNALRLRGWVALNQLDSAVRAGRRAVQAIEQVRDGFASGPLRTSYAAERGRVYADLVLALLKQGDTDGAFAVADAARGRALLEHLSTARSAAPTGTAAAELAEAERLLRRIDQLLARLSQEESVPRHERGSAHGATGAELMRHLEQARSAYRAHLVRVAERDPASARWLGVNPTGGAEIRAALQDDELLVEYLIAADRLFVFIMSRDSIGVLTHPIQQAQLSHQIHLVRELAGSPESSASDSAVSAALHEILIAPVRSHRHFTAARHLIVVPHGILTYLPFAALRNPATGRVLAQDIAISHLPTAAALPLLRARTRSTPVAGGAGFAPFPDRLPSTRAEVTAFQRTVPKTFIRTGRRASEAAVRQALGQERLVHIASHGVMAARTPLFSRIELARGRNGPSDDGRLEVHEVMNLSIVTPLLFLSGCQTGLGSSWATAFDQGRDLESLAHAFLYAGAGTVIATLWRIDDAGAAAFAERFYRHLRSVPPAEALARAQQDLRDHPRWKSPYYWAAYTVNGVAPARPAQIASPPSVKTQPVRFSASVPVREAR